MQRCLELAEKGLGRTGSNPLVGAVIVHNDRIIGEGYHQVFGGPHAEVNAIQSVRDKDLLRESTLYVNLEPCTHHGKTPPCTDLIVRMKIPRVVIGTRDPNSTVRGKGIERLKKNGCQVQEGLLAGECFHVNRRFFIFHEKKRPYIILKWAQSADGYMDVKRKPNDPVGPNWISGPLERILVHQWRSQEQAILVGTNTVCMDDPGLDVRLWSGTSPVRIIIDKVLRISLQHKVLDGRHETIVFNNIKDDQTNLFIRYVKVDFTQSIWPQIMAFLYEAGIISLIVEGGAKTLQSLIEEAIWDEARVFKGTGIFKEGIIAPRIMSMEPAIYPVWNTQLEIYYYSPNICPEDQFIK